MIFAKLFERDGEQVVVRMSLDDDGNEIVVFDLCFDGVFVSTKLGFKNDKGARLHFSKVDEDHAFKVRAGVKKSAGGVL